MTALVVAAFVAMACVLVAAASPAQARSPRTKLKTKVVKLLKPVPRAVRHLPRRVGPDSRRRSRSQAKRALRAARRGRFCQVIAAVALIDHVGRSGRRLAKVERLLRRSKVVGRCRDRGHKGRKLPVHIVAGGAPGSGVEKPHPRENEQGEEDEAPPLPIGPQRKRAGGRGKPAKSEANGTTASGRPLPHAFGSALNDPIGIFRRTSIGKPATNLNPLDPSSATAGDVVLVSGNLYLAISTDGGRTFTYKKPVDIFSTSVPASLKNPDGGACCDQVLHYDAATDRFYWLLQYWCTVQTDCQKRPGENRYRLAVASPKDVAESGGTRWRFWDITSQDLGLKKDRLDFPDLAVGKNFLYATFNTSGGSNTQVNASVWARFRKTGLRDGTLDWWYHRFPGEVTLKPVQNTRTTGFVVRRSSTSELELKTWKDSTTSMYADKIPIGTPPTQDCSATSPDKQDFLKFQGCGGGVIQGAAMQGPARLTNGRIWVAWTGGRREEGTKNKDGSDKLDGAKVYPQPHVELAVLNGDTRTLIEQSDVWNPDYAFAYPYLAGGPSGEIAMTYMAGGGKQYPGWGVGYLTNKRSFARIANASVGAVRVGDYLAIRPAWPSTKLFSATGNVLDAAGFLPYYSLFGRSGDKPPNRLSPIFTPVPPRPIVLQPDLVITTLSKRSVTVRNAGNAAAGIFFVNVTYNDGNGPKFDRFDVPSLAAGVSTTLNFDCRTGAARVATADTDGQVAESNESNNTATATFTPADCSS